MVVPFHFLSGPNSSKVVTGLNAENWGEKEKRNSPTIYSLLYTLVFDTHFYTMGDKVSSVNVIFSCPSLFSFRFHIIFYRDA